MGKKSQNTFKFQLFSERIAGIKIDAFRRIHEFEESDNRECIFHQTVEKWDTLNLTEAYDGFRKELRPEELVTLPQLMHKKEHVVQVLLKHLRNKDVLYLQPLFELTVALTNDLRKDFYEYYQQFLDVLIYVLDTKDTDQLEWTFTCLAFIFKYLWRPMITNVHGVFASLLPLLSDTKPEYINNFAAESFAYIVRKVDNKGHFLRLLLKGVKSHRDGVKGCGRLLFEIVKTLNRQFHSCADKFIPFLLESLSNSDYSHDLLFEVLEEFVVNVVEGINPHKGGVFWKACVDTLDGLWAKIEEKQDSFVFRDVDSVFKLVGLAIEHKDGRFLHNPVSVAQCTIKFFENFKLLNEDVLKTLAQVSVLLLISKAVNLPQEHASFLVRKIMALEQPNVILHFVENVIPYVSFENQVLLLFLRKCIAYDFGYDCFRILTKLVLVKSPPSNNGIGLETWNKYPLNFGSEQNNDKVCSKVVHFIEQELDNSNFDDYFCAVVCLPHLVMDDQILKRAKDAMIMKVTHLCEISSNTNLLACYFTLESLTHVSTPSELNEPLFSKLTDVVLPRCLDSNSVLNIRIINLYFSFLNQSNLLSYDHLMKLHQILEPNFLSPKHEFRLLTTHIYSLFEKLTEFPDDWKVFSLCYDIESTSPSIQTYRDQLKNVELLAFHRPQTQLALNTPFKTIPLRYLCGLLYMNFKLLWQPTIDTIVDLAEGLDIADFWSLFHQELNSVITNIRTIDEQKQPEVFVADFDYLTQFYGQFLDSSDKVDFANYRILLWKILAAIPEIAERKNRDLVPLLFDFIEKEYVRINSDYAPTWNIKQNSANVEDEDVEDDGGKKTPEKISYKNRQGNCLRNLQQHLSVFANVKSPQSMHRESELKQLYFDLLSDKHQEIQKLALDCIMTYKHKFLTPYQEHLYNLIKENNFKHELATFRVDTDTSIIHENDREHLIPYILKIVYSKMVVKTGLRTGGKSSGQQRRNLVLRFLGGCHESEKLNFVHVAFRSYEKFFRDNPKTMVDAIDAELDLQNFVPPKRLLSAVNLLKIVLEQFGGPVGHEVLSFMLKVTFVIGALIKGALMRLSEVHTGYMAVLKDLKNSCLKIIERFFDHFPNYPWSSDEIDTVFELFVWPYLGKLSVEGIHSPTVLLKLIGKWGSNARYFPLLVKHQVDDSEQYILPEVMKLLLNKQSHFSVTSTILDMVQNLLKFIPDEEDEKLAIVTDNLRPISDQMMDRLKDVPNLNYGSCILLEHVSSILDIIRRKLVKSKNNLNHRDLFILSRISELVREADTSNEVLKLLLPVLSKKCGSGEDIVLNYLVTVKNLLQNVPLPQEHFRQISPLFGIISQATCRKALCGILELISKHLPEESSRNIATVVCELNSWDPKWVEQPNFEERYGAFKKISALIKENSTSLDLTWGSIIIYNCFYVLRFESDSTLKDYASDCWKNVSVYLLNTCSAVDTNYFINSVFFNLVRKGLACKNDSLRNETILVLGHVCREAPNGHSVLSDMSKLADKIDAEVDFFENITHLQGHRHRKALVKFSRVFRQEEVAPNARTLTYFIIPMAHHYLCNEKYMADHILIEAAIDAISVASRLLPWPHYETVLKNCLRNMRSKAEYEKQLVKLLIAVLNTFHFDLSKGKVDGVKKENGSETEEKANDEEGSEDKQDNMEDEWDDGEQKLDGEEKKDVEEEDEDDDDVEHSNKAEIENETEEVQQSEKAVNKIRILCPSAASRIIRTIQTVLLPQLHHSLEIHESAHKINKRNERLEREEKDLIRAPLSIAIVKLLQQLPKELMDSNLTGVFVKLCTFLKSREISVRKRAQETLKEIMATLGPTYLNILFQHMTTLLSKGYQIHVLIFTVHAVLSHLRDKYEQSHLDAVLSTVLELCQIDLFGTVADEKEVVKIGRETPESLTATSKDTLKILAEYITEKCMMDLVMPFKSTLEATRSAKVVDKAKKALINIAEGFSKNKYIKVENLFKLSYGISSESIPQLILGNSEKDAVKKNGKLLEKEKLDCFIIPAAPARRHGPVHLVAKSVESTNSHVLIEFGLRIFLNLIKNDSISKDDYLSFLDPFVPVLKDSLTSRYAHLSALTLRCLSILLKCNLPSLEKHVASIAESVFSILHKYGAAGLGKGPNFELVVAAFKTMSVLVRDVKIYNIEKDQLKVLLLYVEQDLYDYERQATAFSLLKAIIFRKLMSNEVVAVMEKVSELSITSEDDQARVQARSIFHQYLMDYPLKTKVDKYIQFYENQLNYEVQSGRESAIKMIETLIHTLPMNVLISHSSSLLISMSARLVNEVSVECREKVGTTILALFERLPKPNRDHLFDPLLASLSNKKSKFQQIGAQSCGFLILTEKNLFETRLDDLLPIVKINFEKLDVHDSSQHQSTFQILQMLIKLCCHCPPFLKRSQDVKKLANSVQTFLAHPHEWVRVSACEFIGHVLKSLSVDKLVNLISTNTSSDELYLHDDPIARIKSLTLDLMAQLQPGQIKTEFAEQVVENLVFIARILHALPAERAENDEGVAVSLVWLMILVRKAVNREVIAGGDCIAVRTAVFKWLAALSTFLTDDSLKANLHHLLRPMVREMITTEVADAPLRQLSKKVGKLYVQRVGLEFYADVKSKIEHALDFRKSERKRKRTQLAVTDPELYTRKKMRLREKKEEARKRKNAAIKSGKKPKRRRKEVAESDDEFA